MSIKERIMPFPRIAAAMLLAIALAGCADDAPQALGTLEYDRITLPAPAAERVAVIEVREGERVAAGQRLLQLESRRSSATTEAARAQVASRRAELTELQAGPRQETIDQARARLAAAQAQAREASAYYRRLQPLGRQQLVAAAEVDRARAAAGNAEAQVLARQAALDELLGGTRSERIEQGQAALEGSMAQAAAQQVSLDQLDVVAPRAGVVDSLPYEVGDQPAVGAPLAIMLVGDAPYARIHVLQPQRANVKVGDRLRVHVDGRDRAYIGTVRMIRNEPSFTPYYALAGDDAARLSYLAEVELDADAGDLPAGLPVQVDLSDATGDE